MSSTRRVLWVASLVALAGAVVASASTASGASRSLAGGKPVIGKAATAPAKPLAGKRFTASFKVLRSDTKSPLLSGKMICDPSVAGKVIAHSESFRKGTARLSFVVPAKAAGKVLTIRLTISAAGGSSTKVTAFRVQQAAKPVVSISGASVAEGNAGTTQMSLPVTLSLASA